MFPTAVMRFMGDAPAKGQSELDVLCALLKVSPASFARYSLSCSVAQFPHLSTRVAGLWGGELLVWPKEECIPPVGRGLRMGHQAYLRVPTLFLCAWSVTWPWPALPQLCGDHEVMRDECYCQVVKQITDNTSTKQ